MNFDLMNATPQFVKENKAYDFYVEIVYDFYNKYTDEDFVFLITKNKFELSNEKIEVPQVQLIELYVQLKEPILIRQLESCGDTNGKEIKCELMTEGNVIKVTSQVEGEDNALNYKKYSDSHVINFVSEEVKQITIDTKKPPEIAISPSLV